MPGRPVTSPANAGPAAPTTNANVHTAVANFAFRSIVSLHSMRVPLRGSGVNGSHGVSLAFGEAQLWPQSRVAENRQCCCCAYLCSTAQALEAEADAEVCDLRNGEVGVDQ